VRYLLTGDSALTSRSLWPWSKDPQRTHHYIEKLGQMEGCDWQDMQATLCYWAPWRGFPQQGPFTPTGANKRNI